MLYRYLISKCIFSLAKNIFGSNKGGITLPEILAYIKVTEVYGNIN